jgi:hypothetical protein
MGAVALLLAAMGLLRRDAPTVAKVLLLVGLILPFTPADKWLYSRFTVIFALGGGWLAAWQLHQLAIGPASPWFRRMAFALVALVLGWTLVSGAVTIFDDKVRSSLHLAVAENLPENKETRADWMIRRADHFIETSKIWYPRNIAVLTLIGLGLLAASRVRMNSARPGAWAGILALTTFGELMLFSSTWITWSPKPAGDDLYETPEWIISLRDEVGYGALRAHSRSDFDYLQLNTPTAYGIRFAEGYDTVTPARINHRPAPDWEPGAFAASGISHIIADPERDPGDLPGWNVVQRTEEYILYRNPQFQGTHLVDLGNDGLTPIEPTFITPNRRVFDLPAATSGITLLESHNPGWRYSIDGGRWQKVAATENGAMSIAIDPAGALRTLTVQYRPAFQSFYRWVIAATMLFLIVLAWIQFKSKKTGSGANRSSVGTRGLEHPTILDR